jgi:cytochrome b561
MKFRNDEQRYGAVAQLLHWVIVALFFASIAIAWSIDDLPIGPEKIQRYNLHKSIGVTILVLMCLRLLWRWLDPAPLLPARMPRWERRAARASHVTLYALMLLQPVTGLVHSWAANFPVVVWGRIILPSLVGPDEGVKKLFVAIHTWISWLIVLLVILHIAAALRHHFVLRDDILRRMLPGKSS